MHKRKIDTEKLDTVNVEFFRYNNYSHCVGSFAIEADIGYGVKLAGTEDASPCQIQVNVPEKFAGDDCQLEVFLGH